MLLPSIVLQKKIKNKKNEISNEKELNDIFENLKIGKPIAKNLKSVKSICWFELLRDEMMFTIFEFLTVEVLRLTMCSKKFKASVLFYGEILQRHFQDDLSVMLPRFLKNEPTLFQLNKYVLRVQRQEWSLLLLDCNINGNTKFRFRKTHEKSDGSFNEIDINTYASQKPLYFRHRNYYIQFSDLDSIKYDFQYQFIKLSNGYYKIINPYRNGYCVSSNFMIVPNRNDYLDDISWIIEPKENNLIALKSVKTGKYISVHNSEYKPKMSTSSDCYALFEVSYQKKYSTIPENFKDFFSGYSKVSWESEINTLLMENLHHFEAEPLFIDNYNADDVWLPEDED